MNSRRRLAIYIFRPAVMALCLAFAYGKGRRDQRIADVEKMEVVVALAPALEKMVSAYEAVDSALWTALTRPNYRDPLELTPARLEDVLRIDLAGGVIKQ